MPVFRQRSVFEVARGIKAFFNLEAGLTRGEAPELDRTSAPWSVSHGRGGLAGVNPASMVWIFGTGRSGSTWLVRMMAEMPRTFSWNEPMVGKLFGDFHKNAQIGQLNSKQFILGDKAREGWLPIVKRFVLDSVNYRFPRLGRNGFLIIKEPNSSSGASLITEALPESRMIFLVRDPRDVIASVLDAGKKGGWLYERKRGRRGESSLADDNPNRFVKLRAKQCLNDINDARRAFEAHKGPKTLVRYEDLRLNTMGEMKRLYSELDMEVGEEELSRAVEKHAWENIPGEQKGEGKKLRKAAPGGWKEDLTPEQVEIVEDITAPLLREFYPEERVT